MIRYALFFQLLVKVFCYVHAYKNQKPAYWRWIIILIPLGSYAYILMEVLPDLLRDPKTKAMGSNIADRMQPDRNLSKLEEEVRFSDTVANRQRLADEYIKCGYYDQAIEQLEACRQGIFGSDISIIRALANAHYLNENFEKAAETFENLKTLAGKLDRPKDGLRYFRSLQALHKDDKALKELAEIVHETRDVECTYQCAEAYQHAGDYKTSIDLYQQVLETIQKLPRNYRNAAREWKEMATKKLEVLEGIS